jgi:hypothetical protein
MNDKKIIKKQNKIYHYLCKTFGVQPDDKIFKNKNGDLLRVVMFTFSNFTFKQAKKITFNIITPLSTDKYHSYRLQFIDSNKKHPVIKVSCYCYSLLIKFTFNTTK